MKHIIIISLLLISSVVYAQSNDSIPLRIQYDINELIKNKTNDKHLQTLLIDFRETFSSEDKITVEEFDKYFEIIVSHPSKDGYTGGAEAYKLDKKTGKSDMIWHEHPMQIEEIKQKEN